VFVAVAQPAGLERWEGRTHLVAVIAAGPVLACSGVTVGEVVQLTADTVHAGLACGRCRRLWDRVQPQLGPGASASHP
jgi:hypothetical protein